jgi:hypothetical protein
LASARPATPEEIQAQREGMSKYTPGDRQARMIPSNPAPPESDALCGVKSSWPPLPSKNPPPPEGKDGVAICSSCHGSYVPARRPDPTRRNYCPACRGSADARDASRAYRERKRTEPDEAKEQAISDLLEKIANLPGITPEDLELLEKITQPLNQTHQ